MNTKALIVEDDDRIIESIEDTLFSMGHEHDWATNQHDAQQMLRGGEYDYVLLDLQIPAKPNRGGADKEYGLNLLGDIQRIKGQRRLPVIVMTGYSSDCVDLTTELFANGASEFISKPFGNNGRSLATVIRKVLVGGGKPAPAPLATPVPQVADETPDRPFAGGDLTFYSDRAELCGVKIITDMGAGQSLRLLHQLRRQDRQGRFIRLSAEELAKSIDAPGGVGTVTGCVRAIRRNVVSRLAKHCHLLCQADALIRSDEQGYYLREWITVRDTVAAPKSKHVTGGPGPGASDAPGGQLTGAPVVTDGQSVADSEPALNERQAWVLTELGRGTLLRRADLERRFSIHARTAKRDLAELNQQGLIEFDGEGPDASYVLRRRATK
jgi:CheY-like chemotaxis protein